MTIEEYLAALRGRLWAQPLRRRRVLAGVEDHLRQSAARHGEEEAIRRFGRPEDVAGHGIARLKARSATPRSAITSRNVPTTDHSRLQP